MALNEDKAHPAHSVSDYFEVLKMRYPSLYLFKDQLEMKEITEALQKESAKIQKSGGGGRGGDGAGKNKKQDQTKGERERHDHEVKMRNYKIFAKAFPGQDKYQIGGKKENNRQKIDITYLPDTYFLTFLVNVILVIAVLLYFFNTRNVKEEYYIRKNVFDIFNRFEEENHIGFKTTYT